MAVTTKTVELKHYKCERCGYEWDQRTVGAPLPTGCASKTCKTKYWNTPYMSDEEKRKLSLSHLGDRAKARSRTGTPGREKETANQEKGTA